MKREFKDCPKCGEKDGLLVTTIKTYPCMVKSVKVNEDFRTAKSN